MRRGAARAGASGGAAVRRTERQWRGPRGIQLAAMQSIEMFAQASTDLSQFHWLMSASTLGVGRTLGGVWGEIGAGRLSWERPEFLLA